MSSSCSATSSTISASRSGGQESREQRFPAAALRREGLAARRSDPVETAAPQARLLDPPPLDQPTPLEAIQQRIERGHAEADLAVGALLDQLGDLVAMALLFLDQRQHQHLGAASLHL